VSDGRIHDAAARGYQSAVEHYERGRPSYPDDAVTFLVNELAIGPGSSVVELGAGTGKLTDLLVFTGAQITAVEPVPAMREALARNCPTARVLDGTAEAIPVADATADAVVAAQAFHWFDGERALPEIHRVLREGTRLGLIWNIRDEASDWAERLTSIFDRLAGPDAPRYRDGRWRRAFESTDLFGPLHHWVAYHVHQVSRQAFIDRVMSVSYVASAPPAERERVLAEVTDLLDTAPELSGKDDLVMPYRTDVYVCERR
jgi:SAM-dependent methyltransferase